MDLTIFVGKSHPDIETEDVLFAAVGLAACLAPTDSWFKAPSSETIWHILGMLLAALIAAGAARWTARSTMKNARDLQDRDRRLEERSITALLSADLHRKMMLLVFLLQEPDEVKVEKLATMYTSTKVLEAALPKLGALGQQGAANLLNAFNGVELLVRDAREQRWQGLTERMQDVALNIGSVVKTLGERYDLDMPEPLAEREGINGKVCPGSSGSMDKALHHRGALVGGGGRGLPRPSGGDEPGGGGRDHRPDPPMGGGIHGDPAQFHLPQDQPGLYGSGHPEAQVARVGAEDAQVGEFQASRMEKGTTKSIYAGC